MVFQPPPFRKVILRGDFPSWFVERLVAVDTRGVRTYPVVVWEDPETRERVLLNGAGEEVAAYPAPPWYDPYSYYKTLIGTVFALGQQARGAHFLSHDLWTLAICWFGSVVLFLLMRPYRDAQAKQ